MSNEPDDNSEMARNPNIALCHPYLWIHCVPIAWALDASQSLKMGQAKHHTFSSVFVLPLALSFSNCGCLSAGAWITTSAEPSACTSNASASWTKNIIMMILRSAKDHLCYLTFSNCGRNHRRKDHGQRRGHLIFL